MARKKAVEKAKEGRRVVTTVDYLRVRSGAGMHHRHVAVLHEPEGEKKEHCIIKEKKGWGLLAEYKKLENGWIDLEHTHAVE